MQEIYSWYVSDWNIHIRVNIPDLYESLMVHLVQMVDSSLEKEYIDNMIAPGIIYAYGDEYEFTAFFSLYLTRAEGNIYVGCLRIECENGKCQRSGFIRILSGSFGPNAGLIS